MRLHSGRAGAFKRAVIAALAVGLLASQAINVSAANSRATLKNFQHVFVIMMENTGYDTLIGNPLAPWINGAAAKYGVATHSYGVTHPSQPNYMAVTSGALNGITDDNDHTIDAVNIVDQLESHGKTWMDYQQGLALCDMNVPNWKLAHSCGNQEYERKHNPFVSYLNVQSNPSRMANVVDFSQLDSDLASGHVADYNFIAPDQCNDMHGRFEAVPFDNCNYDNPQLVKLGDNFLRNTVAKITSSSAWNGNSVIFITWDESDYTNASTDWGFGDTAGCCGANPGGGHVLTLVISHSAHAPRVSTTPYNHYSLLATIQDGWKLGCLGATCDTVNVPRMTDLVGPKK